jgi:hypothetical protein
MDNPIAPEPPRKEADALGQIDIVLTQLDGTVSAARDVIGKLLSRYVDSPCAAATQDRIDHLDKIDASLARIMVTLAGGFTFNFVDLTADGDE